VTIACCVCVRRRSIAIGVLSAGAAVSVVLITGASGGVGRALARLLHSQGKRVAAAGRDADRLRDVDAELRIACDVTTMEGAQHAVTACREAFGAAPQMLVSRRGRVSVFETL
jgi:NADP-dependent 3-hydroxy acid dehydrogenase YdfG